MDKIEFYILTGIWPEEFKQPGKFLNLVLEDANSGNPFQLMQSFSRCGISEFDKDSALDFDNLEQYRAFCPDWELWLRNINSETLRFRFIGTVAPKQGENEELKKTGKLLDGKIEKEEFDVEEAAYPLWGEPIKKGKYHDEGWYTQRIPQIIKYPVNFPENPEKKRVFLKVENMLREDGSIGMVRFLGLDVRDE